jgi:hypothetical protein
MAKRPGRKRITFDIPDEINKEMMNSVELHYMTITKWILRAIVEKLKREKSFE